MVAAAVDTTMAGMGVMEAAEATAVATCLVVAILAVRAAVTVGASAASAAVAMPAVRPALVTMAPVLMVAYQVVAVVALMMMEAAATAMPRSDGRCHRLHTTHSADLCASHTHRRSLRSACLRPKCLASTHSAA